MMIKKFGALLLSAVLCVGMAVPAFAYGGEPVEEVEQPVLTDSSEEDAVTVTDESSGALTPEGNPIFPFSYLFVWDRCLPKIK